LRQNYPNPFSPATKISRKASSEEHAAITIYDIMERKINTLIDEYKQPGRHKIDFNATDFSPGIYYYQLQIANHRTNKAMMVVNKSFDANNF
jgi:hypothetical protein